MNAYRVDKGVKSCPKILFHSQTSTAQPQLHAAFYNWCDTYPSMLGLKLISVSKRAPDQKRIEHHPCVWLMNVHLMSISLYPSCVWLISVRISPLCVTDKRSLNINKPLSPLCVTDKRSLNVNKPISPLCVTDKGSLNVNKPISPLCVTEKRSLNVNKPLSPLCVTDKRSLNVNKSNHFVFTKNKLRNLHSITNWIFTGSEWHCIVVHFMDRFICLVYTVLRRSPSCYARETIQETLQALLMYVYGVQKLLPFRTQPPWHVSFGETVSAASSEAPLLRFLVLWYHENFIRSKPQ